MQASDSERVDVDSATLGKELAELKREIQVIKMAVRHKIARYEVDQVKKGRYIESIFGPEDLN